jgi:hypothetical protein
MGRLLGSVCRSRYTTLKDWKPGFSRFKVAQTGLAPGFTAGACSIQSTMRSACKFLIRRSRDRKNLAWIHEA